MTRILFLLLSVATLFSGFTPSSALGHPQSPVVSRTTSDAGDRRESSNSIPKIKAEQLVRKGQLISIVLVIDRSSSMSSYTNVSSSAVWQILSSLNRLAPQVQRSLAGSSPNATSSGGASSQSTRTTNQGGTSGTSHYRNESRTKQLNGRLFVSYSRQDVALIDRIESALMKRGFSFWRDIRDGPAGPLDQIVSDAICETRRVLLVLSRNSVVSDWVEYEAELARALERVLGQPVLVPIALDNNWLSCCWSGVLLTQLRKYNVLDFSQWRDEKMFNTTLDRLVDGLCRYYS